MTIRKAEKAGSWYPSDAGELLASLEKYCNYENPKITGKAIAGIVPHAGLSFSGSVAGKVYSLLKDTAPETIIVFGAVHTMPLTIPAIWGRGVWRSPIGDVEVDEGFAKLISDSALAEFCDTPHICDNSIELQIPFIKHCFPESKIVPIAVPAIGNIEILGFEIAKLVAESSKNIVIIGSSDFTHYGESFGVNPAGSGEEALSWADKNDKALLDLILKLKATEIVEHSRKHRSACGAGAVAATTAYASAMNSEAKILEYTNSHYVVPSEVASHFVGYAGLVFIN